MRLLSSFRYALHGVAYLVRTQPNARNHLAATLVVGLLGVIFKVSAHDWCWLIVAAGFVWVAEAINTAIESLADAVTRDPNPCIGTAKDVAAGAVLIAAMVSVIIGGIVFVPRLFDGTIFP